MANFACMHLNGGRFHGTQVLTRESVNQMHTVWADFYTPRGNGYGLTFFIDFYKGQRLVEHGGDINTFESKLVIVPDANVAVSILVNRLASKLGLDALIHDILDQLLDLALEVPHIQPIEPHKHRWALYEGAYRGAGGLAVVEAMSNDLTLNFNGEKIPLEAIREDLYRGQKLDQEEYMWIGFLPEDTGPTQYVMIDGLHYRKVNYDTSFTPEPALWTGYIGTYVGIDTLVVTLEEGQLYLYAPMHGEKERCTPIDNKSFVCGMGLIEFQVGNDGNVVALIVRESFSFSRVSEDT